MMRTCLVAACSALLLSFFQTDVDRDELEDRLGELFAAGDAALESGEFDEALMVYREALKVNEAIIELDPNDVRTRLNLSSVLQRMAETHRRRGRVDYSIPFRERRQQELEAVLVAHPKDLRVQIALANSFDELAGAMTDSERLEKAIEYLEQGLSLHEEIVRNNPADFECQRRLANALETIGQNHAELGQWAQSLPYYMRAHEIERQLLSLNPDDVSRRHVYYLLMGKIAEAYLYLARFEESREYWREAFETLKRTVELDPDNPEWRYHLAFSISQLGKAHLMLRNYEEAVPLIEQSIMMFEEVNGSEQLNEQVTVRLEGARDNLVQGRRWQLADGDWETLLEQPNKEIINLLSIRCELKSLDGDIDQIVRSAEKLEELALLVEQDEAKALRNAAAAYAICAKLVVGWRPPDPYLTPDAAAPTAEQLEMQQSFIARSLSALQSSIDKGLTDYEWLHEEPYFDALRGAPEFEALFEPDAE